MTTVLDDRSNFALESRPILKDRPAVRAYLDRSLAKLAEQPFLVLYVTEQFDLLSCEAQQLAQGRHDRAAKLVARGRKLEAAAFIIVERRNPKAVGIDHSLIQFVSRLRAYSAELNMPLLDYFLFDGNQLISVGGLRG